MGSPTKQNEVEAEELSKAQDDFITQWGVIGSAWGINRTMAQIHALLMVSPEALSTDEIMAELSISRGNAHSNLRELASWGVIKSVIKKGERKEFFESEKDVWKMFCTITRERKRREIDPALEVLKSCEEKTRNLKSDTARNFHQQIKDLSEFVNVAASTMEKVSTSESSKVVLWALKHLK